jgi:hypothetical protein
MPESGEFIEKPDSTGRATAPDYLWLRLVIFAAIILVMNTWCIHHIGAELTGFTATNAPLAIIAIVGFITKMFPKSEVARVNAGFRGFLLLFLRTPVLTVLAIVVLAAGSMVSSVTVFATGVGETVHLQLVPEGVNDSIQDTMKKKTLNGSNDVRRFIAFTTPFGRSFYLTATGYQRYSFDLKPWIGKKIRVNQDLKIAPSLLIRVPAGYHMSLTEAELVVDSDERTIASQKLDEGRGGIMIGRPLSIPDHYIPRWERELSARGISGAQADRIILRWLNPVHVQPAKSLSPGLGLTARLIISDTTRADIVSVVGSERLQDFVLMEVKQ